MITVKPSPSFCVIFSVVEVFQKTANTTPVTNNAAPAGRLLASKPFYLITGIVAPRPTAKKKAPLASKARTRIHLRKAWSKGITISFG
jgi:hypothetical protein